MNKTFSDRIKRTRTGKFISRGAGQDHFNAKETRSRQLAKKRMVSVSFKKQTMVRYANSR